jgi:hypothetical protein
MLDVNEALCFICQEVPPTKLVTRGRHKFKVCDACAAVVVAHNTVKQALYRGDRLNLFTYALGADLSPVKITVEPLDIHQRGEQL